MNMYYILVGFENAQNPFTAKFTFIQLAENIGSYKDSEMFFALKELHSNDITEMQKFDIIPVSLNRDNEYCKGLLSRVSEQVYNDTSIN